MCTEPLLTYNFLEDHSHRGDLKIVVVDLSMSVDLTLIEEDAEYRFETLAAQE
jgi:hypothetical protein